MTQYDLTEFRWVGPIQFNLTFAVGLGTFAIAAITWLTYGVYVMTTGGALDPLQLVGTLGLYIIFAMFLSVALMTRTPAVRLEINDFGVRLAYKRGRPYARNWNESRLTLHGRRKSDVAPSGSSVQPLWSIYGRFGGLTESFIPKVAFEDLVRHAQAHNLRLSERPGHPGWVLYTIKP
jgi:hypothetical protein